MAHASDTRAQLDRWGAELHARIAELVALCTPEAVGEQRGLGEPEVADWHEPVRYRHSVTVRGSRDPSISPETLATRAADALVTAGWQVSADSGEPTQSAVTVVGAAEGSVVRVRFSTSSTVVLYSGETAALALSTTPSEEPSPVRTSDDVDPGYVLCYECSGTGWCPVCRGRGWVSDEIRGRHRCPECFDRRVCPICVGAGELAVARLSPVQRANYVHLPDTSK
ncbi:hypothetical protein OG225_38760 [Nocardia sp. NBC_01377]|uniref:hypothetical protein n=1 Tax=Nocardia sp. NBC_01377 TaxID=2903595 RepID=UPI00324C1C10